MNKIKESLFKLLSHELIAGSFYVFLGTTFSSFLAFILNIFFARELSIEDYGVLASLLSLVTLLTIPSQSLSAIVVRYATVFFSKDEDHRAGAFYVGSFKKLLIFTVILISISIITFPFISVFLKINEVSLVILSAVSVSAFYLATLNLAFLQSLLKFRLLGLIYSIAGLGKLISGVLLVLLGFKIYGALIATIIFSVIDYVFSIFPLKGIISKAGKNADLGNKEIISYAVPTTIAIFSLSSFISADVLLVKHFFTAEQAGLYGGLSLVGRVIFYFTGPIAIAMFPLIVKRNSNNQHFQKLFLLALSIVLIPSILITIFYFLLPQFTIRLFLGEGYNSVAPFLGLFGIFLTIYSVNNVLVNFFLSVKKTFAFLIVTFFAVLQIILIYIFHDNFYEIILVSIVTSILLLISLVLYYLKIYGFRISK